MARERAPFCLFKRGRVWYFTYWVGHRRKVKSTGQAKKIKAFEYAKTYVENLEKTGQALELHAVPPRPSPGWVLEWVPPKPPGAYRLEWVPVSTLTLAEYTRDWFTGNGPYEKLCEAEGRPLTPSTLSVRRHGLAHLLPRLGNKPLADLRVADIDRVILELHQEGKAAETINATLATLRVVLKTALREGLITTNPFQGVRGVRATRKPRRLLTIDEVRRLLFTPQAGWCRLIGTGEGNAWLATVLAAFTGARAGEVLGLTWEHVHLDHDPPFLEIKQQLLRGKLCPPKNKKSRLVVIPQFVGEILAKIDRKTGFVLRNVDKPFNHATWKYHHRRAMQASGVDYKARNLTIHSWRSWYNTILRGEVPEATLRRVIGHADVAMTDRYDNAGIREIAPVAQALERLITPTNTETTP